MLEAEAAAAAALVEELSSKGLSEHAAREEAEADVIEVAMEKSLVSQLHPAAPLEVQRLSQG